MMKCELSMFQEVALRNLFQPREPLPWLSWHLTWKDRFYIRHDLREAWRAIKLMIRGSS